MSVTVVEISAGTEHARVTLRQGAIVPRLISRGRASARVALVAGGALLLGGDSIDLRIVVGAGCSLDLEDIGGVVAYDGEGRSAAWSATVHVGDGGSVAWQELPFVVADGADVDRGMTIRLSTRASALIRDTVVLGRSGERGGTVRMRTEVNACGHPMLIEGLTVDGKHPVPGVIGDARVIDTVLDFGETNRESCTGPAVEASTAVASSMVVLRPEQGGVLFRALGSEAHRVDLSPVWTERRAALADSATGVSAHAATP